MSGDIIASAPVHKVSRISSPQDQVPPLRPDPLLEQDGKSGYGRVDGTQHPGNRPHEGGDPRLDGDAQYGASPIREARYGEDHDVRSGVKRHPGVQPGRHVDPPDPKA